MKSVDSTNIYALELINHHEVDDGTVIIADQQTKGKGQHGTKWLSKKGENLTLSIVLKPSKFLAVDQFYLSMLTALSVRDFLRSFHVPAKIKWPNDIYVRKKKICGILIQNTLLGKQIQYCIAGIGININQNKFDPNLPNPTSLTLETNQVYELSKIRAKFFEVFESYYMDLIKGYRQNIYDEYRKDLYQKDMVSSYQLNNGEITNGIIRDVKETGQIVLEIDNESKLFSLKDFKYL